MTDGQTDGGVTDEFLQIGFAQSRFLFIPRYTIVAGYYGFTLVVHESVRLSVRSSYVHPSVFHFRMIA